MIVLWLRVSSALVTFHCMDLGLGKGSVFKAGATAFRCQPSNVTCRLCVVDCGFWSMGRGVKVED